MAKWEGTPLAWERVEVPGQRGRVIRQIKARVASAPDGSWYVVWRDRDGWNVKHSSTRDDLTADDSSGDGLDFAGDAELLAEAWAYDLGAVVRAHDYRDVEPREDEEGGWVADAWSCRCGAGAWDFDNIGEAYAAARAHWREAIRAALSEK